MSKFEADIECQSCKGTGLYSGMAEHKGTAVICQNCKGTGCQHYKFEFTPFTKRKERKDVELVFKRNYGYVLGKTSKGGITYKEWAAGNPMPKGPDEYALKELCPCGFWQQEDYDYKPEWEGCRYVSAFRDCKNFKDKDKCWERHKKEFKKAYKE